MVTFVGRRLTQLYEYDRVAVSLRAMFKVFQSRAVREGPGPDIVD